MIARTLEDGMPVKGLITRSFFISDPSPQNPTERVRRAISGVFGEIQAPGP